MDIVMVVRALNSNSYTYPTNPTVYLLPNDENEQDRLDILHELILTLMDRKLFLSPINNPGRALDLGTGTGIWAIDFGKDKTESDLLSI